MVSEPTLAKDIVELVLKQVKKYDEEDEYYLASNDGPGILITLNWLKDGNFKERAEVIEMALESKNKLGFIDGILLQPNEDDANLKRWKKINTLIGS